MNCIFNDNNINCNDKKKFGNYCSKHKKCYLLNENSIINIINFTYKISDYLKDEIINTLNYYHLLNNIKNKKKLKKIELYNGLKTFIDNIKEYNHYEKEIIYIQKYIIKSYVVMIQIFIHLIILKI